MRVGEDYICFIDRASVLWSSWKTEAENRRMINICRGVGNTRSALLQFFDIGKDTRKSHDVCTRVNRNCTSLTRWPHSHHLKKWIQRSNDRLNRFEFAIGNLIETRSAIGYWKSYENVSRFQRCDAKIPLFAFRAVSV